MSLKKEKEKIATVLLGASQWEWLNVKGIKGRTSSSSYKFSTSLC